MEPDEAFDQAEEPDDDLTYARRRRPDRTYVSRSFPLPQRWSPDHGQPARWVWKVFDGAIPDEPDLDSDSDIGTNEIPLTRAGRVQLRIQVVRNKGTVRRLYLEKVSRKVSAKGVEVLLELKRDAAAKLIELLKALEEIPVEGESSVRIDDQLLREIFSDPNATRRLYERNRRGFRRVIENDEDAEDLVALAHRRKQVRRFRQLLNDPDYFQSEREALASKISARRVGRERVWQEFLEANPWILGVSLAGQLVTSWSNSKLEQVVAGFSIGGGGKRVDALMRTSGRIRSMVFAEIKHHQTPLLQEKTYRSECWAPSDEISGGVVQVQQTVHKACHELGPYLNDEADGFLTGELTAVVRPRSYLICGSLESLCAANGGMNRAMHQSFEVYRRNLVEPEVITFDELLARAEWHILDAERSSS